MFDKRLQKSIGIIIEVQNGPSVKECRDNAVNGCDAFEKRIGTQKGHRIACHDGSCQVTV